MSKKSVLDKINPMLTLQKRKKESMDLTFKWHEANKCKIIFSTLVEELNNESKNAIERIQNLNLDPDFYDLSNDKHFCSIIIFN